LDKKGEVTLLNKIGCEILGYEQYEIIGKSYFDQMLPEEVRDEVRTVFHKFISGDTEAFEYYENPILTKNDEQVIVAWQNNVLKDSAEQITGILSSGENITNRKRMEEELLRAQKLESVGTIASGIAHDFNNILTAILGNISLAKMYVQSEEALDKAFLRLSDAE